MERETARAANAGSGFSDPISLTLPSSPEYVLLARLVNAEHLRSRQVVGLVLTIVAMAGIALG